MCHINSKHRNGSRDVPANVNQVPEPQKSHIRSQQVVEMPMGSHVQVRLPSEHPFEIPEPVSQLKLLNSSFMQLFLEQVAIIPQQQHLKFRRKLMTFIDDYIEKYVE